MITEKMIEAAKTEALALADRAGIDIGDDRDMFVDDLAQTLTRFAALSTDAEPVKPEPYGYAFQHEDTGLEQVVDVQQVEWGFERNNPRWQKLGPVYLYQLSEAKTTPAVAVKALEWVEETQYLEVWRAWPDCGLVFTVEDDGFSSSKYRTSVGQKVIGYFSTLIEAKAAAQADYEARVRSALA